MLTDTSGTAASQILGAWKRGNRMELLRELDHAAILCGASGCRDTAELEHRELLDNLVGFLRSYLRAGQSRVGNLSACLRLLEHLEERHNGMYNPLLFNSRPLPGLQSETHVSYRC